MPRGDGRGPNGMGPMTGRRLGYCAGYESPGFTKGEPRGVYGFGRGFGRGFGGGHRRGFGYNGFSNNYYPAAQYSQFDEEKYLELEIDTLKKDLKAMENRLTELKKDEK